MANNKNTVSTRTDSPTEEVQTARTKEVAQRAYEIFLARGGQEGSDLDDWLQAERELSEEMPRRQAATSQR
jgi:hypothetical protein